MLWTWARQKNKPEVKEKKANLREQTNKYLDYT